MERVWWRYFQRQSDFINNVAKLPLVFAVVGVPAAGQRYSITVAQAGTLLGEAGTAFAYIGTAPTATETLSLKVQHPVPFGLITTGLGKIFVSTTGIVTFPLFTDTLLEAGDTVQLVNENPADATFADACFTLQFLLS